jgi:hypothetical protein
MFGNAFHVVSYYKTVYSLGKLYQGLTVSMVRQALFWPIFVASLNFL